MSRAIIVTGQATSIVAKERWSSPMWFMMVAILVNGQPLVESRLPNKFVNQAACLDYGIALNERFDTGVEHVEFGFKCVRFHEA